MPDPHEVLLVIQQWVQKADLAAFMASDRASAMTGAIANLNCGSLVDY